MRESNVWTTQDELATVRRIYNRRDIVALRQYLWLCRNRVWHGDGMRVDPGIVILQVEDYIIQIEREQKRGE